MSVLETEAPASTEGEAVETQATEAAATAADSEAQATEDAANANADSSEGTEAAAEGTADSGSYHPVVADFLKDFPDDVQLGKAEFGQLAEKFNADVQRFITKQSENPEIVEAKGLLEPWRSAGRDVDEAKNVLSNWATVDGQWQLFDTLYNHFKSVEAAKQHPAFSAPAQAAGGSLIDQLQAEIDSLDDSIPEERREKWLLEIKLEQEQAKANAQAEAQSEAQRAAQQAAEEQAAKEFTALKETNKHISGDLSWNAIQAIFHGSGDEIQTPADAVDLFEKAVSERVKQMLGKSSAVPSIPSGGAGATTPAAAEPKSFKEAGEQYKQQKGLV